MKQLFTTLFILFLVTALPLHAGQLKPYSGDPLPDFTLQDQQNNTHTLSDYRGKVVMVNFWATYCTPCIREMPSMQRLKEKMAGKPFAILAVDMAEEKEDVQAFLKRHNIKVDFPLLFDPQGNVIEQWIISAVPTTFIVDKQGNFRYALFGGLEWDSDEVVKILDGLTEE
jgi:peroxiredoxin